MINLTIRLMSTKFYKVVELTTDYLFIKYLLKRNEIIGTGFTLYQSNVFYNLI